MLNRIAVLFATACLASTALAQDAALKGIRQFNVALDEQMAKAGAK